MSDTISTSARRLSFSELLKDAVRIPIIQRDYAQGRETAEEVRSTFLGALYQYLDENEPNRDLDFIYGSFTETEGDKYFIPLDGQQRLTTLFLLHWYLAQISDNMDKLREVLLTDDKKSMFTYETRPSSSMFCDALLTAGKIDFNNLEENSLSKTIKNSSWYYLSWKYDPTIQSMLTMLDAIHKKFKGKSDFFERLIDNRIITFWLLDLKDFKLTDDLYIKMNSRGKPLTPFENFKAKFEQYIDKEVKPERKFYLKFGDDNKNVSLKDYFSYNIDTKWANLFWNYRNLSTPEDTFDNELMNFIRVIFTNQYAMSLADSEKIEENEEDEEDEKREKDDNLKILLKTQNAKEQLDDISFYKYEELESLSGDGTLYLVDAFDCLVNGNNLIKIFLSDSYKFYFDENNIFKNALNYQFTNHGERVRFHAYIRFFIVNNGNISGIEQWMRTIYNLTDNTVIDDTKDILRAIKSIEKILPNSNRIIDWLKTNPDIDFFSSWQVLEEKIKAHLAKNEDWKNVIEAAEKCPYFGGQIGFILEFARIIEYYERHNNSCNWNDDEDKGFFDTFNKYADKATAVFNNKNKYNSEYIWERAVLVKGDYLIDASASRRNLLTTDKTPRDYSWKRLLRIKDDKNQDKHDYVRQVFDDDRFNKDNLVVSLNSICDDQTNSWRDYFITCPKIINYCGHGFIRHEGANILLYNMYKRSHYHVEMYSYYLWIEHIKPNKISFLPFENIGYIDVRGMEEEACIIFNEFCHNYIHYQIDINGYHGLYRITFRKAKGDNHRDKYGDDIKKILEKLEFEWASDGYGCSFAYDKEGEILEKLGQLTKFLKKLTE
jgi:hypothetical protein